MPRTSLLRTASFRLAALYLALFAASTVALGVFVYWSIRHEILADFDEAIVEERDALQQIFAKDGRDRLVGALDARAASGGRLAAGLWGPDGRRLGGDLALPPSSLPPKGGWFDAPEAGGRRGARIRNPRRCGRSRPRCPTAPLWSSPTNDAGRTKPCGG